MVPSHGIFSSSDIHIVISPQDEDNLREALRYCAAMLGELRTSLLGPQKYYELYMQAFDELRHIEVCIVEQQQCIVLIIMRGYYCGAEGY